MSLSSQPHLKAPKLIHPPLTTGPTATRDFDTLVMAKSTDAVGTVVELPVVYTQDMVSTLLELRYTSFKAAFNGNLSSKQLSVLWAKLALRFNIMTDQPRKLSVDSLKNKLRKLRAEFITIQHGLKATGNDEIASPKLPEYYSDMLVAYSDLHGIGDFEFGMERAPLVDDSGDHTDGKSKVQKSP
ncbi:hypothetical protein AC1031_004196 [Aphanomyces cochlioides]|nr:hypothetical protein AC1031_004196 [Aphanomyces cochlioides]